MKVKDCNNCPFRVDEYDEWAVGFDSVSECQLSRFKGKYLMLAVYDRNDEDLQPIKTPDNCPLKEGSITIELE